MLSPEFRVTAIQTIIRYALSVREAATRFNISNESVVLHWIDVYKETDLTGLLKIKRVRSQKVTKKCTCRRFWIFFNREIISYSLSERPVMEMVNTMLRDAFSKLGPEDAPLLHSDQGWKYRVSGYQAQFKAQGMTQSMSRKGNL